MNRQRNARRLRERKLNRWLMTAFAVVLFLGVCLQITMMARLSGQNKQAVALQKEIQELNAMTENLSLGLNQYHNLERIAVRARQLGMEQPEGNQLRVLNLPMLSDGTSTQSADNTGAEKTMD